MFTSPPKPDVYGLLLTGGKSSRMGFDKLAVPVYGETPGSCSTSISLAGRLGDLLDQVALESLEVGGDYSGLESIGDSRALSGPLSAICDGWAGLLDRFSVPRPVLVLAGDMPGITREFLEFLASYNSRSTVIPSVQGRLQPLCALWSPDDLERAVRERDRSVTRLLDVVGTGSVVIDEQVYSDILDPGQIYDVDQEIDLTSRGLAAPVASDDWTGICERVLDQTLISKWLITPQTGGTVLFLGTVRDFSEGRQNVESLSYEAYRQPALKKMDSIVLQARQRWPDLVRVACLHRVGDLAIEDLAVVVGCSAAHRESLFEAASWIIDTIKSEVPIWKYERWEGGQDWSRCNHGIHRPRVEVS